MLTIWDESGDGETDYEEFADMFERIQKCLSRFSAPLVHFDVFENTGAIRESQSLGKREKEEERKGKEFELDMSVFEKELWSLMPFHETEDCEAF